jgi:hypothetical protein
VAKLVNRNGCPDSDGDESDPCDVSNDVGHSSMLNEPSA